MSQVPVKWTYKLMEQKPNSIYEDGMVLSPIPVVPLSALREVVEGLKKQYRGEACYIYKEAFSDLLANLGEVGKQGTNYPCYERKEP